MCFVKSGVGLIRNAQIVGCVNDGLIELENGIILIQKVRWEFSDVCIQTDAQERLFFVDLLGKLLCCHFLKLSRKVTNWNGQK